MTCNVENTEVITVIRELITEETAMRYTVVGAANVDIITKSGSRIIHGDSNPAEIRLVAGGVARNIAENLSRLGADVTLITAIGTDPLGSFLREDCEARGINTGAWIVRKGMTTGVYSAALDCDGELYAGFNAMSVLESIKSEDIALYVALHITLCLLFMISRYDIIKCAAIIISCACC